jgi:selenocysteine lyase/cysteine desulfurase
MLGLVVFYLLRQYLIREDAQAAHELKLERMRLANPLRFQAYERMILLLERITPSQLIMRNILGGDNARQVQQKMVENIRQEFDHNLSQQLYISSNAWELIKNARESIISLVNSSTDELTPEASATDLAQLILHKEMEGEVSTVYKAMEFLKIEVREIF